MSSGLLTADLISPEEQMVRNQMSKDPSPNSDTCQLCDLQQVICFLGFHIHRTGVIVPTLLGCLGL